MKNTQQDHPAEQVRVIVRYKKEISATSLAAILNTVNAAFDEATSFAIESSLLSPFTQDQMAAARSLMALKRNHFFKIREFHSGSVEIVGYVALYAFLEFLLKTTLGKSIGEAFKETQMHDWIKRILLTEIPTITRLAQRKASTNLRQQGFHVLEHEHDQSEMCAPQECESFVIKIELHENDTIEPLDRAI